MFSTSRFKQLLFLALLLFPLNAEKAKFRHFQHKGHRTRRSSLHISNVDSTAGPHMTHVDLTMGPHMSHVDPTVNLINNATSWPFKRVAEISGTILIGGLHMVHERQDQLICGPIMPQGGLQVGVQIRNFSQLFTTSCNFA